MLLLLMSASEEMDLEEMGGAGFQAWRFWSFRV